jgi:YVTN family beta-propeller protein
MKNTKKFFLALGLITLTLALLAANSVHAIEVTATVPVGSSPMAAVYDSGKGEVFVANSGSNSISVISDANDSVVATIPLPSGSLNPNDLAYDPNKGEILVLNNPGGVLSIFSHLSSTISMISDTTDTIVTTITLGFNNVVGICYDSNKGDIVVTSQNPGGPVSFISDTSDGVVSTVLVGGHPQGIVYDSGMGETFVSTEGDTNSWISVIPDNSNTVVANVTVQNVPLGLAYDFGKGEIFAASVPTPELNQLINPEVGVYVISDQTDSVVTSVPMPTGTVRLAYDSEQGEIFVTYAGDSNIVSVISDRSNSVVANVTVANTQLQGLCYDSAKSEIFVTNPSNATVTVISDSSVPAANATPTTVPSSPSVPELSFQVLLIAMVATGIITAAFCSLKKTNNRLF